MMWFLEIHEAQGNLSARYTYAPGYIDAVAVQERDLNADGDFGDDDEVVYYHTNTLFSVYALTDATENVVDRYRYDAYGACAVLDGDWSPDADGLSDVQNPYTFTGRRFDAEDGIMQYRHRYYSTALGRFIGRDPIRKTDSLAHYTYVLGNPLEGVDPLGQFCIVIAIPGLWHTILPGIGSTLTTWVRGLYHTRNMWGPLWNRDRQETTSPTPVASARAERCPSR